MSYLKRTGTAINDIAWDETELATKAEFNDLNTKVENISGGTTNLPYLRLDGTSKMVGDIELNSHHLHGLQLPQTNYDATPKLYVDNAVADLLPLAGGTMTGKINMSNNRITNVPTPTEIGDAVPKKYVDDAITGITPTESYLPVSGGTLEGNLNMGNHQITNVDTLTATNIIVKGTAEASASIKVTGDASRSEIDLNDASDNPVVVKGVDTPADNNDGANKAYVDAVNSRVTVVNGELTGVKNSLTNIENGNTVLPYLPISGGTLTGNLTLNGEPVANNDASTKKYVDDNVNEATELTVTPSEGVTIESYACIKHHKLLFFNVVFRIAGDLVLGEKQINLFKIENVTVKPMKFTMFSTGRGVDNTGTFVSNTVFEMTCDIFKNGQILLNGFYAGGSSQIYKEPAGTNYVLNQMFAILE